MDDCWNWSGHVNQAGYGEIYVNHKRLRAHRVVYTLFKGIIPEHMCICHTCDNKKCVNPEHLFLGTQRDNMADMARKRRNGKAKITFEIAQEIRGQSKLGHSQRALARQFHISQGAVYQILSHKTWKI